MWVLILLPFIVCGSPICNELNDADCSTYSNIENCVWCSGSELCTTWDPCTNVYFYRGTNVSCLHPVYADAQDCQEIENDLKYYLDIAWSAVLFIILCIVVLSSYVCIYRCDPKRINERHCKNLIIGTVMTGCLFLLLLCISFAGFVNDESWASPMIIVILCVLITANLCILWFVGLILIYTMLPNTDNVSCTSCRNFMYRCLYYCNCVSYQTIEMDEDSQL